MFLKSIEIKGFKSFADKTEIVFKNGITSIVGPNGSGKSNISDAVRWVLGEQSIKNLRGGKMEDVIFSGTQYRKPVGLSQVSLILDNNDFKLPLDFSDITISRRLYRSGDSDYLINNAHCRLKDIQELFMDTGIGKEGYSIIGQGKIEAILSGKQDDRRSLLEEAAGIVKFRFRKEEAEKKLYNTDQNLIRINDILDTYIERLEPLKLDAEKADKFIKLSENLKIKELNILVTSIDANDKKINNITSKLEVLNSEVAILKSSENEYKMLQKKLSSDLEQSELLIEENNKQIYENKTSLQNLESDNNLFDEKLKNLNMFNSKSSKEIEELDLKFNSILQTKNKYSKTLELNASENNKLNMEIKSIESSILDAEIYFEEKSKAVKILKDNQLDFLQNISDTKNEISILDNNLGLNKSKIENSIQIIEGLEKSIQKNSNIKIELQKEILKQNLEIDDFEKQIFTNNDSLSKLINFTIEKENKLKELNLKQNKLEANKTMLINLDKKHEGYNKSVKVLFQDISDKKIQIGKDTCFLLGDVIDVSREYETAIEIAIGGSISDVITDDEEIAKKLINYLKVNGIGRATFLPLSIIKPKTANNLNDISKMEGYLGLACDLINYDIKFENAISYLLGRTLICTNMDSALKIAKKTGYFYKIVTLLGEVVNPSGSMTGGSVYHKNTNVIGRKREIEELSLELEDNLHELGLLDKEINLCKSEIKALNENNSEFKEEIHNKKIEITKVRGKIIALEDEIEKLKESLNLSNSEIEIIKENINIDESKIDNLKNDLFMLENRKNNENIQLSSVESELKNKEISVNSQKDELTEKKIKSAQLDEIVQNYMDNINRLSVELNGLDTKKLSILSEKESSNLSIHVCQDRIEKNKILIEEKSKSINIIQELINDLNINKIKIKDEIKLNSEEFQEISSVLSKKENEMHRLEILKGKYETEKDIYYSKLNDELGLTYAEAIQYKTAISNMDDFKEEINGIKNEISKLGIVNLGAIEEYKEVKEKISFMGSQRDDLNNSKEELKLLINEMTGKMKQVFKENFVVLRKFFNETFCELFKGGSADLILADGDELEGNIDIEVQPPGKKLQNINLLSGGEKGLSAIALLFAILKMKPTPFCILDEIEAALDDANVSRYADFLKKFSKNIQFIVITHRKGTMEVSDALYGVTMEEKGVSKIVSVDFSK